MRKRMKGIRISDAKAYCRLYRICDFDIKESAKSGVLAVSNGIKWVSEKMKEKIDPSKYASEKEARAAEKQKAKELGTIKGCLKEIGRLIKNKLVPAKGGKLSAVIDKIKSLCIKIKDCVKRIGVFKLAGGAILGVVLSGVLSSLKNVERAKEVSGANEVENMGKEIAKGAEELKPPKK